MIPSLRFCQVVVERYKCELHMSRHKMGLLLGFKLPVILNFALLNLL